MKKFLLSVLLLAGALLPTTAQQRTEAEAEAIAKAFMQNNGYDFNVTKSAKIKKIRTEKAGEITPYYIFNDTQKGGFVIVGGQEAMSDILAYSDEDCFDIDDMPPAAKMWLETYAASAQQAADYPVESMAAKKAAAKAFRASNFARRQNVYPLLGEIKYNQGDPYNRMCPELTLVEDGKKKMSRAVTGCTNTAMAMLMRYWRWPIKPNGQKTYTFNYDAAKRNGKVTETASMTLSIDFDQEPEYKWDLMLPRYNSNHSYTTEEANEIARLMLHAGMCNQAGYGLGGTGSALRPQGLVDYFSYARDFISDSYSNYKTKGDDAYREMLADELSQGRPIWAAGSNAENTGAHSYICDGYDLNGLFHFNLGWDGGSNGYYEVAPVPMAPYAHGMYFYRNLHPKNRLTPSEPLRRVIMEGGLGDWNTQNKNIINAWKGLNTSSKYGESMICIATADTEEEAEAYLPGLSGINDGLLLDRCDTLSKTVIGKAISQSAMTAAYKKRYTTASPANLDIDAMYASDSTMAVTVYTEFYNAHTDADYRLAFVYTEDNVKIEGISYNYIARGMYPDKNGYAGSIPSTIEYDTEYTYENIIPIPSSIKDTNNATLIVMLIDGKTGVIANANTVDLKQINTWRANQKPAFYNEKILADSTATTVYGFDEEKNRMPFPVKINNPLYEKMPIEITAEAIELSENTEVQLGETANATSKAYSLTANAVDSTLMLYLNIKDKFQSAESTIKLTLKYNGSEIAQQIVHFNFIESEVEGANAYTVRIAGSLSNLISATTQDTLTTITLGGRLCGNDFIYLRDKVKAQFIDLSKADIVAGPGAYYGEYLTEDNLVGIRLLTGFDFAQRIILPETATEICNYAFYQNKQLSKVVIGNNVTTIGNYAFSGCESLERLTIPASVTSIGRQAFKNCPLVCLVCESETPAEVGSKAFDGADLANATLVVPTEAAVEAYKAAKIWKDFGNIITYDSYLTSITPVAEEAAVAVKDGKIIIDGDAEVAIYTFAGKQVAAGKAGAYALPAGNYIVKIGNNAVKVKL